MARPSTQHGHWARLGATARLAEIHTEIASIYRAFPELKAGRRVTANAPRVEGGDKPKRRQFSAAGKKAISQGMREYWARRKALAAKTAKAGRAAAK